MSATHGPRSTAATTARLTDWFEPAVTAAGYDLEELVVRPAGNRSVVRVVVDRDSGVSLDDVAEVSRVLSEVLDAQDDDMGRSPYVLEVTSPGVDRPLTLPRHWRRNIGRLISATAGDHQVIGRVICVDAGGVTIAVEKGGAKKGQVRKAAGERAFGWAELDEARVQVEFNRPAGHRDAGLVHEGPEDGADDDELTADDVDDELDAHADEDQGEQ